MRNCKSRSSSQSSDRSKSQSPILKPATSALKDKHKPIISVTPSSKLLTRNVHQQSSTMHGASSSTNKSLALGRKRRSLRLNASSLADTGNNGNITGEQIQTPISTDVHQSYQNSSKGNTAPIAKPTFLPPPPNLYPLRQNHQITDQTRFITHTIREGQHNQPAMHQQPPHKLQQPHPRTVPIIPTVNSNQQQQPATQLIFDGAASPIATADPLRFFGANQPPITIFVPYPVIVPIPIPIPIPMPLVEFMRATQIKIATEPNNNNITDDEAVKMVDEPLDCTKSKKSTEFGRDSPPLSQLEEMIETEEHQINNNIDPDTAPEESINIKNTFHPEYCNSNDDKANNVDNNHLQHQKKLPKIKITRLNAKREITSTAASPSSRIPSNKSNNTTIVSPSATKITSDLTEIRSKKETLTSLESNNSNETSRPLRKRKRVVDCDYLKYNELNDINL